jgi:hypothetical protein
MDCMQHLHATIYHQCYNHEYSIRTDQYNNYYDDYSSVTGQRPCTAFQGINIHTIAASI